jgi:hypothetical protein
MMVKEGTRVLAGGESWSRSIGWDVGRAGFG